MIRQSTLVSVFMCTCVLPIIGIYLMETYIRDMMEKFNADSKKENLLGSESNFDSFASNNDRLNSKGNLQMALGPTVNFDPEGNRNYSVAHACDHQVVMNNHVIPSVGGWQVVDYGQFYVYSAFLDPLLKENTLVHVVALMSYQADVYCQLWSEHHLVDIVRSTPKLLGTIGPRRRAVRLGLDRPPLSTGARVACLFRGIRPTFATLNISLSLAPCDKAENLLPVQQSRRKTWADLDNFRVCIAAALRDRYSDYRRFVEFMELNAILGAKMTYLYRHKVDPSMYPYFDYYEDRGLLEVRKFKIPKLVKTQVYGQTALIQDCVMRNVYKAKYVVLIDLDESIVPRDAGQLTWSQMLTASGCLGNSIVVARNVFHRLDFPNDVKYIQDSYNQSVSNVNETVAKLVKNFKLVTMLKTWRTNDFLMPGDRSKAILRPEHIDLVHIHRPQSKPELRESPCFMEPEVGALHHYRKFRLDLFEEDVVMKRDRTFEKYEENLVKNVGRVYDEISKYQEAYS